MAELDSSGTTLLSELLGLTSLQPEETLTPETPGYEKCIQTWASQKQLRPRLVIRPTSVESLSKVIARLYESDLDFAIYGHGFMSTSARDVVINMSAFDGFHFDEHAEIVTVGAGQTWRDVYRKLEEVAPQYGIVGARTPAVGVAGTIISGGLSWISGEYGCISDPDNMLDAKVVKYDGSVVWASREPDLLWALRGGGGGFGAIVQVILRVFPYPQNIWGGPILIPREKLEQVAEGIERFLAKPLDPKVTMLFYVLKKKVLESMGVDSDMLLIHALDALGEQHGRDAFRWALDIPGAVDRTEITSLAGVAGLQDKVDTVKGTMKQFWAPMTVREYSRESIIKAVKWSEEIERLDPSLAECTYLIIGLLCAREPAGGMASCALPRPKAMKHTLVLGTGCPSGAGEVKEHLAHSLAAQAASKVFGEGTDAQYIPSGLEDFQDPRKVWGPHFARLQELRRRYDPRGRFKAISTEM
ncbi:FAD-binding oxidoreductase [Aspergillus lucknowensis]|uniref:FAD binding domain-containing protein n=1 Tax=Aspergillus lucknowensis TaxID=176173 RepID=A0ABR4LDE1_9EURO